MRPYAFSSVDSSPSRGAGTIISSVFFVLLIVFVPVSVRAERVKAHVVNVIDGDSMIVSIENQAQPIRLADIDAPELGQPFGGGARDFLQSAVGNGNIELEFSREERYGKFVALVHKNGQNLNEALLRAGLAWHFARHSNRRDLAALESMSRKTRKGLWGGADPIPPWEFRKRSKTNKSGNPYTDYYDLFERYPHIYTAAGMVTSSSMFDKQGAPAASSVAAPKPPAAARKGGTAVKAKGSVWAAPAPKKP